MELHCRIGGRRPKKSSFSAEIEVADDPPAQNQRLERDAAHSRREKLIDDRVGLKVGPPEIPFLIVGSQSIISSIPRSE